MTRPKKMQEPTLAVRAVRTQQADRPVYAFFVAGADLLKIAEINQNAAAMKSECKDFSERASEATSKRSRSFWIEGPCFSRTPSFSRFRPELVSLKQGVKSREAT